MILHAYVYVLCGYTTAKETKNVFINTHEPKYNINSESFNCVWGGRLCVGRNKHFFFVMWAWVFSVLFCFFLWGGAFPFPLAVNSKSSHIIFIEFIYLTEDE